MSKILGIDLGTTNSCVAIIEDGKSIVIANEEGKRTTPSIVAFTKDGKILVGEQAKRQGLINPQRTIHSIKRLLGQNYKEVGKESTYLTYKVIRSNNWINAEVEGYTPQEISAMILQKMKRTAEDYLGYEVKEAVITVPAYFNDAQRNATKEAGEIAGLNVRRIINEPTAAALAYGLDKKGKEVKVAVFHLGGGSVDMSILELQDVDGALLFEVLSTSGIVNLGGDDFDRVIVDWVAEEFMIKRPNIDLRKNTIALKRLQDAAEKAKIELSVMNTTSISLPYIHMSVAENLGFEISLSRTKFEELSEKLFQRCLEPCQKAITAAKIRVEDIKEVILVGGSTRIPKVQAIVKDFFKRELNKSVNPDEAVAMGAAIQGSILSGDLKDIQLLDVISISLGIETQGGMFTRIVEANTTIPHKKTETFTTAADNQPSVEIHILQGEWVDSYSNRTLGRFHLEGLPPAPRGIPQVEVTFDIDANGILNVSAKDKYTGQERKVRITASTGLSEERIQRMKKEVTMDESVDFQSKKDNKVEEGNNIKEEPKHKGEKDGLTVGGVLWTIGFIIFVAIAIVVMYDIIYGAVF